MTTPDPEHLDLLALANRRLVRTVDGLDDKTFESPSLLPGWTVGHVVAHVALNGEALAGVLAGVTSGTGTPMYASQDQRDRDVAELGEAEPGDLRSRLLASTTLFDAQVAAVPKDGWETVIERTPGRRGFRARATVLMRLREVEIHHADLGVGYTKADWSPDFSAVVIDSMRKRDWPSGFRVTALDLGRTWQYGDGRSSVTVSGESQALAWWLTGRDDDGTLTVDGDALPEVPAW